MESKIALEEAKLVLVVGDEHVLGLSVGVEHHLVGLTAVSGLLVSTEGSVSGVQVVAVHPHTASLNGTRHLVLYSVRQYQKPQIRKYFRAENQNIPYQLMSITSEHTSTQAKRGIVGNGNSLLHSLEGGHGHHGAEDLLLEDSHVVLALEDGGLDVVSTLHGIVGDAASEDLSSFLLANFKVFLRNNENYYYLTRKYLISSHGSNIFNHMLSQWNVQFLASASTRYNNNKKQQQKTNLDLLILLLRGLGTNHGSGVQGMSSLDGLGAGHHQLDELLIDVLLNEHTRGAGAHLALVERKHDGRLQALVQEVVVVVHARLEEDQRRLATEFHRHRGDVLCGSSTYTHKNTHKHNQIHIKTIFRICLQGSERTPRWRYQWQTIQ
jgi:hypothetical protein